MVELVVVIVLIGILGAIGASRFFDRSGFESRAVAEQVRSMLRFAQKAAIARNRPVYIRFEENRISLCHAEPKGPCAPADAVPMPGGFTASDEATREQCGTANWYCIGRPAGIAWDATPAPDFLAFDALGRPIHPGGRPGGMQLTVSGGGDEVGISVSEETGYVQ
jgi:MSHA pilin protein MshC